MVGTFGFERSYPIEQFREHGVRLTLDFIHDNAHALSQHDDKYLGGWIDGDFVYLDVSERVMELDAAEFLGRKRGQIAIYDVRNDATIYLPSTAEDIGVAQRARIPPL